MAVTERGCARVGFEGDSATDSSCSSSVLNSSRNLTHHHQRGRVNGGHDTPSVVLASYE